MNDLRQLAKDAARWEKTLRKAASDKAVQDALYIHRRLLRGTPVATTEAESNWQVSAGFPITREVEPYSEGDRDASAAIAQEKAKAALARKKVGQLIWIVNTADHIEWLNQGSSPQAPAGFIDMIIGMAIRDVQQMKFQWPGKL